MIIPSLLPVLSPIVVYYLIYWIAAAERPENPRAFLR